MPIKRPSSEPRPITWEPWALMVLVLVCCWFAVATLVNQLGAAGVPAMVTTLLLVLAEVAVTSGFVFVAVRLWRRYAPGRGVGMAQRHEIAAELGADALWRRRWLLRPDLYPKPEPEPWWKRVAR